MVTAEDIWSGDWHARIQDRIRSAGFDSVSDFLQRHPNHAYYQAARVLGHDIAAVQLGMMHFEEAKRTNTVRQAAMDALCRALHSNLKHGWNGGIHAKRMMAGAYSEWLAVLEFRALAPELSAVGNAVWNELNKAKPPTGWLPSGPDDPTIVSAFNNGWPATTRTKLRRQSYGLLCPKCTAVLSTPADDVHIIACPHCGERIELV